MKSKPRGKPVTTLRVHVIQLIEQRIDGLTQQAGHDFRPLMEHFFFFFFFIFGFKSGGNEHTLKQILFILYGTQHKHQYHYRNQKKKIRGKKKKKTNFEDFFSPLFF